jgi:Golgi nucleoside diphosphatase
MREERPPAERDAELLRRRPGLSAFATRPVLAAQQVLALVQQARRWVPVERQASTPLYLKATAGLRLLPGGQSQAILDTLHIVLSNRTLCPFRFAGARIISGEEEAFYGWLSINALVS